jgi:MFS family permease
VERHRDFRLLFIGQLISFLGSMVSYIAVPYQVYQLTRSNAWVGALGLAQLIPVLLFGLLGGAYADRINRRLLVGTYRSGGIGRRPRSVMSDSHVRQGTVPGRAIR